MVISVENHYLNNKGFNVGSAEYKELCFKQRKNRWLV